MFELIGFISLVSPLTMTMVIAALALRSRQTRPPLRRRIGQAGLILLAFVLLDYLLLAVLPRLQISYGDEAMRATLLVLLSVRLSVLALFGMIWMAEDGKRSAVASPRLVGADGGLISFGLLNLIILVALVWGACVEPSQVSVSHLSLPGPGEGFDRPLRIVQLSDLHVERLTRRDLKVLDQVRALRPDLIVLTGDYLNLSYLHDAQALADARDFLSQLEAPLGVYAVNGSVDDRTRMQALFRGQEITVLDDAVARVPLPDGELVLLGVSDRHDPQHHAGALDRLAQPIPEGTYTVLLHHTPDLIATAAGQQVDLYLAGHTHGGQVRLPVYGAILTNSAYGKQFEMGRYKLGVTTLYVSRGLGLEGSFAPRIRFLCPPEVVLIELG